MPPEMLRFFLAISFLFAYMTRKGLSWFIPWDSTIFFIAFSARLFAIFFLYANHFSSLNFRIRLLIVRSTIRLRKPFKNIGIVVASPLTARPNPPVTYSIWCQQPLGMNRVSPCSKTILIPFTYFNPGYSL